jgi:large subunit ribosomal protein L24
MKIKKGDNVFVISGKDRGRKGKVLTVDPVTQKISVEGISLVKRHVRPRKSGEKGQIVQRPALFPSSKVKVVCGACSKAVRVGYSEQEGKKVRICKSCKAIV